MVVLKPKEDLKLQPGSEKHLVSGAVDCDCTHAPFIHFLSKDTNPDYVICRRCGTTYGEAPDSHLSEVKEVLIMNGSNWCFRQLEILRLMLKEYDLKNNPKKNYQEFTVKKTYSKKYKDQILGKLKADNVDPENFQESVNCLSQCVLPVFCVKVYIDMLEKGELK